MPRNKESKDRNEERQKEEEKREPVKKRTEMKWKVNKQGKREEKTINDLP